MVDLVDKSPSAKNSFEYYRHIDLLGSEWDKIRVLNENVDRKILLKVTDKNYSSYDIFREYLLIQNPRNTSEVNVAYKNPGEEKGKIVPVRNLRKIDEVFIGGKNEIPGPNEYFRPKHFDDIENYDSQDAFVKISSGNESHYAPGNLYKSGKENFYFSFSDGESKKAITRKSIDKLLVKS
ncbi:MAG: hypothetical protein ABEI74_00645 [Candidatus Pacearchaeota archaeon]